jgi:hypothetical protein
MEKLLKLINEYEESRWETIDDWLTEEERENWAIIEEQPTRKEYQWHLRHCNAKTVAYEKDTFDAYALSKKYGFIRWLVKNWHTTLEHWNWFKNTVSEKTLITVCAISDDPIKTLMNYLS